MPTTTPKPSMYQIRIAQKEKDETFAVFEEMGIKPAQAVRLFFRHVRRSHALPFPIEHIPNEKTAKILSMNDDKKDYVGPFDTVDALFADLRK
jgi:addiction module RelB/DinJ family antitoxin